MRSGLLSDLATVGYEIALEGGHVKLRYRKSGNPPDTVRPLIDELRKYKAEVVNILQMGSTVAQPEKSQPQSIVKADMAPGGPIPHGLVFDTGTTIGAFLPGTAYTCCRSR